jgi:hypothetical protein
MYKYILSDFDNNKTLNDIYEQYKIDPNKEGLLIACRDSKRVPISRKYDKFRFCDALIAIKTEAEEKGIFLDNVPAGPYTRDAIHHFERVSRQLLESFERIQNERVSCLHPTTVKILAFDVSETLQTGSELDDGFGQTMMDGKTVIPNAFSVLVGGIETAKLLKEIQDLGIPIYLVTNNGDDLDKDVVDRTLSFLSNYGVIIPRENYLGPPKGTEGSKVPRLKQLVDQFKISQGELLFFDDSRANIEEAQNQGFKNAIRVKTSKDLQDGLRSVLDATKLAKQTQAIGQPQQPEDTQQPQQQISQIQQLQGIQPRLEPKNETKQPNHKDKKSRSSTLNIGMMVLGGVIATLGIAAVALALTLLSAPFFGIGLGLGIAGILGGFGLFASFLYKNRPHKPEIQPSEPALSH